jgi:hypothetical protein
MVVLRCIFVTTLGVQRPGTGISVVRDSVEEGKIFVVMGC